MNKKLKAASEFLKSIGCTDITAQEGDNPSFGKIRAMYKANQIIASVEVREEWGQDIPTPLGNWASRRYPYNSTKFRLCGNNDERTHYIVISGDEKRVVLTPKGNVDTAAKSWLRTQDENAVGGQRLVPVVAVPNWTPKLAFFFKDKNGWARDVENVWEQPKPISMNADEFLASLG